MDIEEIRNLIKNNQINNDFPYLKDPNIMYQVIKENPALSSLIGYDIGPKIIRLFDNDTTINEDLKKVLFKKLIKFYDSIPFNYIDLIETEEEYQELASNDIYTFIKLANRNHPYKEIEQKLFFDIYEDKYIYNPDYPLNYAKKSAKVLLNTIKKNPMNMYNISFFHVEAFTDEVLNYIEEKNLISYINNQMMNLNPKLATLKVRKNPNIIFTLHNGIINKEMINYLESIHFSSQNLEEYIQNSGKYPACILNPDFILILVKEDLNNIKYFQGTELSSDLVNYLVKHNYIYQKKHNPILLQNDLIFQNFVNNSDIQFLLLEDINLNKEQRTILANKIINDNIDCSNIQNKYLFNDIEFNNILSNSLKIDNPYNLESRYLLTSLGRSLPKLRLIFNDNDIKIIIRELIQNNYPINMLGILENIEISKFKILYDKLSNKENKFNDRFNFYYFIKVTEYFSNNLNLLKEINEKGINDLIVTNLALIINNKDIVNYEELNNYKEIYINRIDKLNISSKDKIYRLVVNANREEVERFLTRIIDVKKLLYLQLEFAKDSKEYQLLEIYLHIVELLEKVSTNSVNANNLYEEIKGKLGVNVLFDLKVMQENILKLYGKMYQNLGISKERLREKGKVEQINGNEIFHIDGEDFVFFVHTENFNNQDDFTALEDTKKATDYQNYLCTSFASEMFPYGLTSPETQVFDFSNINSLIAFGNKDIFIYPSKKPLFTCSNQFENPTDMAFIHGTGYTPTEFDFLRYDDQNIKLQPSYIVAQDEETAKKMASGSYYNESILVFNEKKHQEYLMNKFNYYCNNIEILNYKELYKLIAMASKMKLDDDIIVRISTRINELNDKERIVLIDAMNKYHLEVKNNYKTY